MKIKLTATVLMASLFFMLNPGVLKADTTTVYFPTLGNCYLCKLRIEECVNKLEGIEEVTWDYNTDITTVTYEETITDPYIIMDAIALVGHDTEWFPAPDSSYQTLVGTCCEYERTMDYTNVQIGYLSLMDLWVFPVGIDDPEPLQELSINPSAGNGIFYFTLAVLFTRRQRREIVRKFTLISTSIIVFAIGMSRIILSI